MTKIYEDGDGGYVALVAHGEGNEAERGDFSLYGLIHYCITGDKVELFDGADGTFYEVDLKWNNLDWDVVNDLLDAEEGKMWTRKLDDAYYDTIRIYAEALENDLVRESLSGFGVHA